MSRRKTSDVLGELAGAGAPVARLDGAPSPQRAVKTVRQHDGKPVKLTVYVAPDVAEALDRRWHEAALAGDKVTKSSLVEAALRQALDMGAGS